MALSPKDQERIIEEEKLRFKIRQDLQAEACARHPRRGRWLWVVALLVLGWALWHHACGRYCGMEGGLACHHGDMMGMPGACSHRGWMVPPPGGAPDDGAAPPAPKTAPKQ